MPAAIAWNALAIAICAQCKLPPCCRAPNSGVPANSLRSTENVSSGRQEVGGVKRGHFDVNPASSMLAKSWTKRVEGRHSQARR